MSETTTPFDIEDAMGEYRRESEDAFSYNAGAGAAHDRAHAIRERIEAEFRALRADALRYRFLRDNPLGLRAINGCASLPTHRHPANYDEDVDEALVEYLNTRAADALALHALASPTPQPPQP